ncbi:MAG: LpxI family protein [Aquificaceae bacterium]
MIVCLIAGAGDLPCVFRENAERKGIEVFTVGVKGITSLPTDQTLPMGKIGRLMSLLENKGIRKVVMLGKFEHKLIFSQLFTLDQVALSILKRAKDKKPQTIVKAIMQEMEDRGFEFIDPRPYLESILAPSGRINQVEADEEAMEDGLWGFTLAKEIASLDIGQTIVVKEKSVVSVEAMEGTQEAIERAGKVAGKKCRVIKVARRTQDFRIDVPTVGPHTVEAIKKIKGDALFLEAGKVYMVQIEKTRKLADMHGISIYGL